MSKKNNISWKNKPISQQPNWANGKQLQQILLKLKSYPNIVVIDEIQMLKQQLKHVSEGKAFIVQGGDCAETFSDFSSQMIKNKLSTILQMSAIIKYTTNFPVINIGRIAGQFAKPRSNNYETRGENKLPIYRGDAINDIQFNQDSREANPQRLLKAYHQSAATMNLIRSLIMDGFTDVHNIQSWGLSFLNNSYYVKKYHTIAENIKKILKFTDTNDIKNFTIPSFYTSHESLLLDYEETFLKYDKYSKKTYNCSGHMLWIGDKTRDLNEAHIDFVSKIDNPIGIKIGPSIKINDIPELCYRVNPNNESGKLILIIRLGSKIIDEILPDIITVIKKNKLNVILMCDPMHGNTTTSKYGFKTRDFDTIKLELQKFVHIVTKMNCFPGGVHFELTGDNVTECIGGMQNITDIDLENSYQTACDPRLNHEQSLEMAFLIADYMNEEKEI